MHGQLYYLLLALFYLFWDTLKACFSPFFKKGPHHDFKKDICLITGAAQGVGRLFAKKLATRGAVLVLWDIQEEKLKQVADEIRQETGADVHGYVCDISRREDVYRVAKKVKEEVGDVSVLINNAGVMTGRPLLENKDEDIERTYKINALANFWTVKAFLPSMMKNNYGYILNIASILGFIGLPYQMDYCSTKAAVVSFSECLRYELKVAKKTGISVTCACPYQINTLMFAGFTSSMPALFPILDAQYVVDRTIQALEDKQFLVALPRSMYSVMFTKGMFPTRVEDAIKYLMGADQLPSK